jgi:hypothetical protein
VSHIYRKEKVRETLSERKEGSTSTTEKERVKDRMSEVKVK